MRARPFCFLLLLVAIEVVALKLEVLQPSTAIPPHIAGRFREPTGFQQSASGQYFVFDRRLHAVFGVDEAQTSSWEIVKIGAEAGRIIEPTAFSGADRWAGLARAEIDAAHAARKLPVLCGGTGLYLRALMQGFSPIPEIPPDVRVAARALLKEIGAPALRERLAPHDPEIAARLHPNDPQRICRAWEVWQATGRPLSAWQKLLTRYAK